VASVIPFLTYRASIDTEQHLEYLQDKGFYTKEQRKFVERAVLKFPGILPVAEEVSVTAEGEVKVSRYNVLVL
jgi:hypothetical protein